MKHFKDIRFRLPKRGNLIPPSIWMRLAIVLGLTILYIVIFVFLAKINPVSAALISIPVLITGWYFGVNAGIVAGLLAVIVSTSLLTEFNGKDWLTWFVLGVPGNLIVVGVGYIAGLLNNEFANHIQTLGEMQFRDRNLTLINMATRDILTPQETNVMYQRLVTHLVNLFVADYAYLIRWDANREQAFLAVSTVPFEEPNLNTFLGQEESELILWALDTAHVQAIEDVTNSDHPTIFSHFGNHSRSPRSALCIPLITKDQKLGVVIIAFETLHHFNTGELTYAEFAADQIALALWNIQQESEIQKRLKVASSLAGIEQALSETEHVGIEIVLKLIVDSAKDLIPEAKNVVLHLLDEDHQILIPRAVAGTFGESVGKLSMHPGEGVAGEVFATGKIVFVPDAQTDSRLLRQNKPVEFRSLIVTPIQWNERCVGTISVQSDQPNVFTLVDNQLLYALGTEAAIAIQNANLLETTRQDLKEIDALYRISRELAASLDPDQLMEEVVNLLKNEFGYYHVQIFTVDPKNGDFLTRRGNGKFTAQLLDQSYRLPIGSGIVGHVIETRQPFFTNNVDDVIFFIRNPLLPETQSELAVPIKIGNEVVGALDIHHARPSYFTERDMQLMISVCDQLAVALQKAQIYTDLQEALRHEQATRERLIQAEKLTISGRLLASVSHELNNPIQAIQNALFLLKEEHGISAQGKQDLEIVLSETDRMAALLGRLRATYQPASREEFQRVQLNDVIEDIFALVATHLRHSNISYAYLPYSDLPPIMGVANQLRQVFLNLVMNAVDAMPTGGNITIATQFLYDTHEVLIKISDTGTGIDQDILPDIFEAFVTTKDRGTGLGLAISYEIILKHQGRMQAENNQDRGATFNIWLPAYNREQ